MEEMRHRCLLNCGCGQRNRVGLFRNRTRPAKNLDGSLISTHPGCSTSYHARFVFAFSGHYPRYCRVVCSDQSASYWTLILSSGACWRCIPRSVGPDSSAAGTLCCRVFHFLDHSTLDFHSSVYYLLSHAIVLFYSI